MAKGDKLKLDARLISDSMVCTSKEGEHYWYRGGRWEQLQPDGSYTPCSEPDPKHGMLFTNAVTGEPVRWDGTEKKWKDDSAYASKRWKHDEQGIDKSKGQDL